MVAGGRRRGSTEIGCPQLLLVQVLLRSRQCSRQVSGSAISVPDWCLAYDSNDDEGDSGSETEVIRKKHVQMKIQLQSSTSSNCFEIQHSLSWMEITTMGINSLTKTLEQKYKLNT